MKKLIILLMAASMMLTSCGKSAGLSNSNKRADDKTSAADLAKKKPPQGTNNNNNAKQSWTDTPKRYWHTATNFVWDHKVGIAETIVLSIVFGLSYYYRKDLANWILGDEKAKQIKQAKQAQEDIDGLTAENDKLVKDYKALEKKHKDTSDTAGRQIDNANTQISHLEKKKNVLEKGNKAQAAEIEQLQQKNNDQSAQIQELQSAITTNKQQKRRFN